MTHIITTEAGIRLADVSCALRQSTAGGGWHVIADTGHEPSGVTGVIAHEDHLEISHDVGAVRVVGSQTSVDEYYAGKALRIGASVGLALTRLYLYSGTSTTPLNPSTLYAANGNLWFDARFKLPAA